MDLTPNRSNVGSIDVLLFPGQWGRWTGEESSYPFLNRGVKHLSDTAVRHPARGTRPHDPMTKAEPRRLSQRFES